MNATGWFLPYLKQNRKMLLFVTFFGLLTAFSAAFLMFTSGYLISKSATRPENILLVYIPIVGVRAFGITRAVSRYVERLVGHNVVLKILSTMRSRIYQLVEPRVFSKGATFKTGDLLGILADDIERLQDIYIKTIFPSIVALSLYTLSIIALGFFSIPFACLMAIHAGVLLFLYPFVSLLVTKAKVQRMKATRHHLYEQLTDAVMGINDWQISGRQRDFIESYEKQEQQLYELDRSRNRFVRWRDSSAQVIIAIMVIVMLFWTAWETSQGDMAYTLIAAFVLVLFPLTEAFLPISDAVSEVPSYQDSIDRLTRLSDEPKEEQQLNEAMLQKLQQTDDATLTINHVAFQYGTDDQTLKDVTFTMQQGEKIALLGPSGSGKSTILKLIEGAISPEKGSVQINGVDTTNFGNHISNWVAVLNQQPYLFDTTIQNNIRLGKPSATDQEVEWAAKQVKLHDYITSLPEGYNTHMHETGMRLSGGQRHRIALARILLQDAPIVILDEPTIGLDPITEKELLTTIFDVLQEKSVLWITHHLAFVSLTDYVLFLDKGTIHMEGKHEHLLQTNERYARLYKLDRPFT
ncbi:thiol reductant ABC exporter subunit CydC [Pontibacillus litoralis]|uniref:ATP-binding protein n=1 Tax=Pontibacillus litoralis JSM 072002 TaxID=1385512 RepID=A0A0A5FYG2_9BACI|nr:thiol reductant ABC exporter subunit CydC [Pontibacillus litoralis]KGX85856.1 ATP-binding protein [Pontibacillus litoralis JSM 072002]